LISTPQPESQTVVNQVTQLQDDAIVDVVESTTPSVVSIIAKKDVPQYQQLFNSPMDLFFGVPQDQQMQQQEQMFEKQKVGGGTGFFISDDGMIVTNRHVVIDPSAEYTVITSDGTEYPARILARDEFLDFAVLKVDGENFSAVDLGDSDNIKIGQTVIAIGNSLGEFSHSVSRGIISGMKRDIVAGSGLGDSEQLTGIIQTDAAINFGNSGGPLIDLGGKVIGINTAVAQGAQSIGFAIPINQVMRLIEDVKEDGIISRPFLGIRYVAMTPEIAAELSVPYEDHGVLVVRGRSITDFAVLPGSPADEAGIVENDIVLEINGEKITQDKLLSQLVSQYNVDDTVTLKVWHKGDEKEVDVILEDRVSINQE
ncbi:MAG: trypsin-like peptidase domain-containing protein, partial [Patescibacteria group bacterium]|nr:trypsin-like peptidase domain-containing protein [Patescibacteria group bacterium]